MIPTLSEFNVSRLYIKDDFAADGRGSYYLGECGKHNVENAVRGLIDSTLREIGKDVTIIFVGSSKGAYASIYFQLDYANSYSVIAAPQYLLGEYLIKNNNFDQLVDILGSDYFENDVLWLNNLLRNKICNNKNHSTIFLQFSELEPTYENHIQYLIKDLKENHYLELHTDIQKYAEHSELGKYYKAFLIEKLRRIIDLK